MSVENLPFVAPARAQTYLRDFEAHRKAVRSGDVTAIDQTWDDCERWVDQLRPDIAEALAAQQKRIEEMQVIIEYFLHHPSLPEKETAMKRRARAALKGESG